MICLWKIAANFFHVIKIQLRHFVWKRTQIYFTYRPVHELEPYVYSHVSYCIFWKFSLCNFIVFYFGKKIAKFSIACYRPCRFYEVRFAWNTISKEAIYKTWTCFRRVNGSIHKIWVIIKAIIKDLWIVKNTKNVMLNIIQVAHKKFKSVRLTFLT